MTAGRNDAVREATRLFDDGHTANAANLLWRARQQALAAGDEEELQSIDEAVAEQRARLAGDRRLAEFDALVNGEERATPQIARDVSATSLGIVLVGAVLMFIGVFLPQFESTTFAMIEKNSLIQNGDGWVFIVLSLIAAGAAVASYTRHAGGLGIAVTGLIGVAFALFYGLAHSQLRLCSAASNFLSPNCSQATPGIGIYAAGIGAALVVIGGWLIYRAPMPLKRPLLLPLLLLAQMSPSGSVRLTVSRRRL